MLLYRHKFIRAYLSLALHITAIIPVIERYKANKKREKLCQI